MISSKTIILNVDDVRGDGSRVAVPYEPRGFTAYGKEEKYE